MLSISRYTILQTQQTIKLQIARLCTVKFIHEQIIFLLLMKKLIVNPPKFLPLCVALLSNTHVRASYKDTNVTLCTFEDNFESAARGTYCIWLSFGFFLWLSYLRKTLGTDKINLASRMQNLPLRWMSIVSLCFVFLMHFHRLMVHRFFATFHLILVWFGDGKVKGCP